MVSDCGAEDPGSTRLPAHSQCLMRVVTLGREGGETGGGRRVGSRGGNRRRNRGRPRARGPVQPIMLPSTSSSPPASCPTACSPAAVCPSLSAAIPCGGGNEAAASSSPFSASAPSFFTAHHTSPLSAVFSFHRPFSRSSSSFFLSAPTLFGNCSSSPTHSAAGCSARVPIGSPAASSPPPPAALPPSPDAPPVTTVIAPLRALAPGGRMSFPPPVSKFAPQVPEEAAAASPPGCVGTKAYAGSQSPPSASLSGALTIVVPKERPEVDAGSPTKAKRFASEEAGESAGGPKLLMGSSQKPHYMPLQCRAKRIRRNLISGYDRAFTETVETIQSMRSVEFERGEEDLRMTLDELEAMGYSVTSLRRRLDVLKDASTAREAAAKEMDQWMRKVEEREEELRLLRVEIAEMRTKESEKEEDIRQMMRWVEEIRGGLKGMDDRFGDMARTPLL